MVKTLVSSHCSYSMHIFHRVWFFSLKQVKFLCKGLIIKTEMKKCLRAIGPKKFAYSKWDRENEVNKQIERERDCGCGWDSERVKWYQQITASIWSPTDHQASSHIADVPEIHHYCRVLVPTFCLYPYIWWMCTVVIYVKTSNGRFTLARCTYIDWNLVKRDKISWKTSRIKKRTLLNHWANRIDKTKASVSVLGGCRFCVPLNSIFFFLCSALRCDFYVDCHQQNIVIIFSFSLSLSFLFLSFSSLVLVFAHVHIFRARLGASVRVLADAVWFFCWWWKLSTLCIYLQLQPLQTCV